MYLKHLRFVLNAAMLDLLPVSQIRWIDFQGLQVQNHIQMFYFVFLSFMKEVFKLHWHFQGGLNR